MRRVLLRAAIIAAASAALLAAASSVTAAAPAGPAKAPRPGQWTRVTFADLQIITDIGLVRGPNGVLHVMWADGNDGAMVVRDTPVLANGTVGKPVPVTGHLLVANDPDATTNGRTMYAFWNQLPNKGNASGTAVASWPAGGHGWKVTSVQPTQLSSSDYTLGAAAGPGGKPWVAFVDNGGNGFEVWHIGHPTRQIAVPGCCAYQAGFGVDSRTGAGWLAWYSNATNHTGIEAQRFTAAGLRVGAAIRMPGSHIGNNAVSTEQRTTATGLGHHLPGVYLTYVTGWPAVKEVKLIKLGAKTATTIASSPGAGGTTLAADPSGRLWVGWYRSSPSPVIWLRRAGSGASKFGPTIRLSLPRGTSTLWKIYLNAQAKRVDVLALVSIGHHAAYYATQVLPPR